MRRKIKTCVLHIGTEKTGTTTLQAHLALNRDTLLERGFMVPICLSPYRKLANHERLTTYALRPEKIDDDLRVAARLISSTQIDDHRAKILSDLQREIENISAVIETLLLSNEHCHSRLVEEDEVALLKELLSEFAEDFKIVVYLRPQHELAVSLYTQALKAGHFNIGVLPQFSSGKKLWVNKRYFDYFDLINRWSSIFGVENIIVRIYSEHDLINGNVIDDFFKVINCDQTDLQIPVNHNVGMPKDAQAVLNAFNRFAYDYPEEVTPQLRGQLIKALESLPQGAGVRPSRIEAEGFFRMFEDSNQKVRQLFFPDRDRLFFPNFDRFPDEAPAPLAEADSIIRTVIRLVTVNRAINASQQ